MIKITLRINKKKLDVKLIKPKLKKTNSIYILKRIYSKIIEIK